MLLGKESRKVVRLVIFKPEYLVVLHMELTLNSHSELVD